MNSRIEESILVDVAEVIDTQLHVSMRY